jgi:Xylose isomerase-like TIM barrel
MRDIERYQMQTNLSVITDEIASSLDDVLAFAAAEKLQCLEVRQIDGANFLALEPAVLKAAAARIAGAGLKVTALTTPLLKWPAPIVQRSGQPFALKGDQFGFDPRSRPVIEHFKRACEAAHIFGARFLRIFSYLAHDGFQQTELDVDLTSLIALAEAHDVVLLIENEPVCNIRTIEGLLQLMCAWEHPRLRCLLDIGNVYGAGGTVTPGDLAPLMPYVPYMHIKDYHTGERRHAVLGEGSVPYAELLPACLAAAPVEPMILSLEVHVPGGAKASLAALRKLVGALA